jgi:ClpA/ClpB-like protein
MTRGKRTTVLALTGAVVLASGAYALGSQAGDGSAAAAKGNAPGPVVGYGPGPGIAFGGPPPGRRFTRIALGLGRLAARLGVSREALRSALQDVRPEPMEVRANLAQELADALGIDVAKVQAAFDKLAPRKRFERRGEVHRRDFAAGLAKQLGLTTAKVEQALRAQRDHRGGPDALAKALGVTPQKLRQAFEQLWKDHGPPGARTRVFGPRTDALAKELGVTRAQLTAAFDKVRAAHEADMAKVRDEFAQRLADRLHVDVAKVKAALDDFLPRFEGKHP